MAAPPAPDARRLGLATLAAAGIALVVLVGAILPAEYGVDPTGIGAIAGFTKIAHTEDASPLPPDTPSNETYAFEARFALFEDEVGNWSGRQTTRDIQHEVEVPLTITNLTRLTARLTWTDDVPTSGPDTFEVSIRGKGRETQLSQSDNGFANATLSWRSVPYPNQTADGGLRLENASDTSSHGTFRVIIRMYGTGASDAAPDNGNDWALTLHAERYEVTTTSLEGAADRVTLTLPPRGSVEYKFAMQPNATMTYRWSASAPLYMDLHADHFDDPDDFTSAKIGVFDEDHGTYTAPYHGRHGWYWRNDASTPVTIELETRGDYTILGVVR